MTRGWGPLVRGIVSSFDDGGSNNGNLNHCHLSLHALTTNQLPLSGVRSLQLVLPISFCTLDYNRIKVVDLNHSKLGLPALYFQHNCMISFICLNTSSFAEQQSCSTAYHLQHAPTVPCCPPTKEADAPATCTHSASPTHLGPSPHLPSNRAAQTSLGGRHHTLLVATLPTLLHQHPAAQWGKGPEPCTANPCALQGGGC